MDDDDDDDDKPDYKTWCTILCEMYHFYDSWRLLMCFHITVITIFTIIKFTTDEQVNKERKREREREK